MHDQKRFIKGVSTWTSLRALYLETDIMRSGGFWTHAGARATVTDGLALLDLVCPPLAYPGNMWKGTIGTPMTLVDVYSSRNTADYGVETQCRSMLGEGKELDFNDPMLVISAWAWYNKMHVEDTFDCMCTGNPSLETFEWEVTSSAHMTTVTLWSCVRGRIMSTVDFLWRLQPSSNVRSVCNAVGLLCEEEVDA